MSLPHTYIPQSTIKPNTWRTRRTISEERDNLGYGIFKLLKEKFSYLMKIMLDFRAPTSPLLIFLGGGWSGYLIWLLQKCPCKENKPREIPNPKEQTWRGLEHVLSNLRSKLSKYESQPRKSTLLPFVGVKETFMFLSPLVLATGKVRNPSWCWGTPHRICNHKRWEV